MELLEEEGVGDEQELLVVLELEVEMDTVDGNGEDEAAEAEDEAFRTTLGGARLSTSSR